VSPGTQNLLKEIASWGVSALMIAYVVINFESLKGHLTAALGVPTAALSESAGNTTNTPSDPDAADAGGDVVLKAGGNGHFETEARVNGKSINVMVDTGATVVALTYEDAQRAGISLRDRDYTMQMRTANGIARGAPVQLDKIAIGSITVRNVKGVVAEQGKLFKTLLGMSFLSRVKQVEMRAGKLVLNN
jgi:aspartyl protease family protein